MVGTAVYQVGWHSSIQPKNFSASKPGVQNTCEPADSGASTPAMRPWMWNSGMMLRPRSAAVKASDLRMWRAEAHRFCCDSGTIFGREVVPEVCSTMATSSGSAKPPLAAGVAVLPAPTSSVKLPAPAPASGTSSTMGTPSFLAAARAGVSTPRMTISSFAFRSSR